MAQSSSGYLLVVVGGVSALSALTVDHAIVLDVCCSWPFIAAMVKLLLPLPLL